MDEGVAVRPAVQSSARFLLEAILLFAVLGAPYLILDPGTAKWITAVFALGYLTPLLFRSFRRSRDEPPIPWWQVVLASISGLCGAIAAFLLMLAAGMGWILGAFPVVPLQTDPELSSLLAWVADIFSKLLVGSLLLFALCLGSFALLLRCMPYVGNVPDLLRANWFRILRIPLADLGIFMTIWGLVAFAAIIPAINAVYEGLTGDSEATFFALLAISPISLFGPLAAAALLVIHKPVLEQCPVSSIVSSFQNKVGNAGPVDRWGRTVLVTGAACVLVMVATFHPIHFGLVAAYSTVEGIRPMVSTIASVEEWIDEQRDGGKSAVEVTNELNEHGYWTHESPNSGLSKLVSDNRIMADFEQSGCGLQIVADTADPARIRGITWIDAEQASLDVKYCVKVSCPSPVAWDAVPSVVLYSSHASRNRYWVENFYIDIFAQGNAAEPGGYCTASGTLADDFQG